MNERGLWVIWLTFALALLLTIMPLPEWGRAFRPQWAVLVLVYWNIALPHRVGVGQAFVLGILLDVLTGTLLGQHALTLSLIAFIAIQIATRVRVFPLWQQALIVLVLLVLDHLIALWIMGAIGQSTPPLSYWLVPAISALLWPWVLVTLRDIRRRFRVS